MYFVNLLGAFCGLFAAPALAQSFAEYPEAQIETYPVTGATPAQIFASITRNSPAMIHAGRPAHAYARSQFHWRLRARGNACEAQLQLDLAVVFPAHVDPDGLTGEAWTWWDRYSKALEMHEAGHLQIAYSAYPALLEALENGPCETAQARADAVLEDLGRRQDLYDQMTNHGAATSRAFG